MPSPLKALSTALSTTSARCASCCTHCTQGGQCKQSKGQKSRVGVPRRHKHWLPSIFELRQLRELTVTAGSTWVRLPQAFCHLTRLERLTIQMRIEGGYDPCKTRTNHQACCRPWHASGWV